MMARTWRRASAGLLRRIDVSEAFGDIEDALDLLGRRHGEPVRALPLEGEAGFLKETAEVGRAGNQHTDVGFGGVAKAVPCHRGDVDGLAGDGKAPLQS